MFHHVQLYMYGLAGGYVDLLPGSGKKKEPERAFASVQQELQALQKACAQLLVGHTGVRARMCVCVCGVCDTSAARCTHIHK